MKVLMLVAHGSRQQGANQEIEKLAARIGEEGRFDAVVSAFLEFAEPDIHRGIEHCVRLGASEVVVVPYFLAAGNHVMRDIPRELACARAGHPDLQIHLAQHVGASAAMGELVLKSAVAV